MIDRKYALGICLVLVVCVLWTVSSVVVRDVERSGVDPLLLSYVANSLFITYLPVTRAPAGGGRWPPWKAGLVIAPLWFGAQALYNASLKKTSVASSTVLSSTSALFALGASAAAGIERVTRWKVFGCVLIIAGVGVVAGGGAGGGDRSLSGDACALGAAGLSGLYTAALAVVARDAPERTLGFVGAWVLGLGAGPAILVCRLGRGRLRSCVGPFFREPKLLAYVAAKGLVDNVLSDGLWARAVLLASPSAAAATLNFTVPLAFLADALGGSVDGAVAWTAAGAALVVAGVAVAVAGGADADAAPPAADSAPPAPRGDTPLLEPDDLGSLPRAPPSERAREVTIIVPSTVTPRRLSYARDAETPVGGLSDAETWTPYSALSRGGGLSDDASPGACESP